MSHTVLEPDIANAGTGRGRWMVVIFNNDHTPMDVVMDVLMEATGCDEEEAFIEMWEAHHFGKAPVHFADQATCTKVAGIIENVGVKTEVAPEWND